MTELMNAKEAREKSIARKVVVDADKLEKAKPFLEEMVSVCADFINTSIAYGLTTTPIIEINTKKLSFWYTTEEAYNILADYLIKNGYECTPHYNHKKIKISW